MTPGRYTFGWRFAMACVWIGSILALSAIWNSSTQLGLSTWWLGPRGNRMPVYVNLLPFVGPTLMTLGVLNNLRWLPWLGVAAAAPIAALAVVDLDRVPSIGRLELGIAVALIVASLVSVVGTYRRPDPATR